MLTNINDKSNAINVIVKFAIWLAVKLTSFVGEWTKRYLFAIEAKFELAESEIAGNSKLLLPGCDWAPFSITIILICDGFAFDGFCLFVCFVAFER